MAALYTTMSWREMKILSITRRILSKHNYMVASGELRNVLNSQQLPMHREIRGPGSMIQGRPVRTVELPEVVVVQERGKKFPRLALPAPKEMRAIDASRL